MYSLLPVPGVTLPIAFAALSILEIALFFAGCYLRMERRREYLFFSLLALCLAGMIWTSLLDQQHGDRFVHVFWMRAEMVCAIWFVVFLLEFVAVLTDRPAQRLLNLRRLSLLGGVLTLLAVGTALILRPAHSYTAVEDVFDDSQGPFYYWLCFLLLSGGLYACGQLWRRVLLQDKATPGGRDREPETAFSLARFLKRIALAITLLALAFAAELYNDLTPNGWEWEIIPHTLAAFCFCLLIGGALWSELLRLQVLRRRTEALAQARFEAAYDTQHQIHNQLAFVQVTLRNAQNRLQRGQSAARITNKLEQSVEAINQLRTTLSLMLDMARIEKGEPPSLGKQSAVDIGALLRDLCLKRLSPLIEGAAQERTAEALLAEYFTIQVGLTSPFCYVFAWPLEQVLSNLLDNALKYSPHPHSITVSVHETDDNKLQFAIRDRGVGIAPEDLKQLFERPFDRGKPDETKPPGSGIGLNLARRYVRAQGGHIWAESDGVGRGSTFYVLLPFEAAGPPQTASAR